MIIREMQSRRRGPEVATRLLGAGALGLPRLPHHFLTYDTLFDPVSYMSRVFSPSFECPYVDSSYILFIVICLPVIRVGAFITMRQSFGREDPWNIMKYGDNYITNYCTVGPPSGPSPTHAWAKDALPLPRYLLQCPPGLKSSTSYNLA